MKKSFLSLFFLFLFLLCGCQKTSGQALDERVFRTSELEITLDTSFAEANIQGYERCYTSKHVDVFLVKEAFDSADELEGMTLSDYAAALIKANGLDTQIKQDGSLFYFDYVSTLETGDFHYYSYLYKSDNAFWVVQFAIAEVYREQLSSDLLKWAKSVTFYA